MENIRNFCIIAHIDSGKSTLADRFLEVTHTVEARNMRPQYLDKLDLERERGITIKMAPVRMTYTLNAIPHTLNLIDTPGHSDFSYEVSRALAAVEGAILLIDATKGIQAQTLSTLRVARKAGLKIIGAVNKVDLFKGDTARIEKMVQSVANLIEVEAREIFRISAKTGEGVAELLAAVVERVPPPTYPSQARESFFSGTTSGAEPEMNERSEDFLVNKSDGRKILSEAKEERELSDLSKKSNEENIISRGGAGSEKKLSRALIFDSLYDDHKGIIAFVRVFSGEFKQGEEVELAASGTKLKIKEAGFFVPEFKPAEKISSGEIGYIATGIKEPALVKIGDTIISNNVRPGMNGSSDLALPGYKEPAPVVFISFYPDGKTGFEDLKKGLERLRLNDAALSFEPDANEALGRGLKVGFLGQLHFEITTSRLEREFGLEFLTSFPSIAYRVEEGGKETIVTQPQDFPDKPDKVWQPMIRLEIISPQGYLSQVAGLKNTFDLEVKEIKNLGDNLIIDARMPLAELIRDFDDRIKSASAGYASFSYELDGEAVAEVERLEILVVGETVPALTRIVSKKDMEREARRTVEKLKELLPREQFSQAIQAKVGGRIVARETIPAMKKELGNFGKNGGDRTRKMKLWKKQQRGKERLKQTAHVELSPEVFREILKK